MTPLYATVLLYSAIPVLAAAIGAAIAVLREPGPRLRSSFQHMAATLGQRGMGRFPSMAISVLLAFLVGVGAILASTLLAGYSTYDLAGVIAFGSVALLYLVTDELLVEAHEVPHTAVVCAMFFLGFLIFLVLEMQAG